MEKNEEIKWYKITQMPLRSTNSCKNYNYSGDILSITGKFRLLQGEYNYKFWGDLYLRY